MGNFITLMSLLVLVGCGGSAGDSTSSGSGSQPPTAQTYSIGGAVSGLIAGSVGLRDAILGTVSIQGNGSFVFPGRASEGSAYSISVVTQPIGQICTLANGTGTVPRVDISNVQVSCAPDPASRFQVTVSVEGLSGAVTLNNSDAEVSTITANGSFSFPTGFVIGSSYNVSITAEPVGQTCRVTNGSGIVSGGVTNVLIACSTIAPPLQYSVGGTVVGSSSAVLLRNNGADTLSVGAPGAFAFTQRLLSQQSYAVSVAQAPAGQSCVVSNGSGTIASSSVTSVVVTCTNIAQPSYSIGGTVSANTSAISLRNNGIDTVLVSSPGPFVFTQRLLDKQSYSVAIAQSPTGQTCSVTNGAGVVAANNVTTIAVTCTTSQPTYSVGGTVSGLIGTLQLRINSSESLLLSQNGAFRFVTPLSSGATYTVTIGSQPATSVCTIANATGTASPSSLTGLGVVCSQSSPAALAGPDLNGNGIRDDLEDYARVAAQGSERRRQGLLQLAAALQRTLSSNTTAIERATIGMDLLRADQCISLMFGNVDTPAARLLTHRFGDTLPRLRANGAFEMALFADDFRPDRSKLQLVTDVCDFDPATLPN